MASSVTLDPVTRANYRAVCKLATEPGDERFVAPNSYSLTQGAYEPGCGAFAIMAGDEMVGFLMCELDPKGRQWILRLMIAAGKRRLGHGRAAMEAVIALHRGRGTAGLHVSFVPENRSAELLYLSLGFVDTGLVEDDERVFFLKL
jgi:diamine N-acetyltransferase